MMVLSEKELAELLNISKWTVRDWRLKGGLPYIRVGRRIFYQIESVRKWMNAVEASCDTAKIENFVPVM